MSMTISGTQIAFPDASTQNTAATGFGFKNRLINGAMVIDQRNAGASVTVSSNDTSTYINDRWQIIKNSSATISAQQTTTAPTGFVNSLCVTVSAGSAVGSTNYLIASQRIEGTNFSDMAWGTASAQSVTVSFWVKSSLTGTFAVCFSNAANTRNYGANYTISLANTWEQKTVTISGDTTGTWLTDTGIGLNVYFSLGAGSSYQGSAGSWQAMSNLLNTSTAQNTFLTAANTFYITGVQLEKGSTATSFDYRPYGTELALCQRYYYKIKATGSLDWFGVGNIDGANDSQIFINLPVPMRTAPTSLDQSGTASDYLLRTTSNQTCSAVPTFIYASTFFAAVDFRKTSHGFTSAQAAFGGANVVGAYLGWSAEL